jgi:hypothetical protein
VAVVVTAASGYDLRYIWRKQAGQAEPERSAGGYYINAAQVGSLQPVVGPWGGGPVCRLAMADGDGPRTPGR